VLSGRGLCDGLITRPEVSYRLWCVVVCDLENLKNEEAMTRVGSQRHSKKYINKYINPLNAELNPICYLLALLGVHHFLHFSRIRVNEARISLEGIHSSSCSQ